MPQQNSNEQSMSKGKAIIYIRVSTNEQARKGYSLEAQEEYCRKYCKQNDYEVVDVVSDDGETGRNLKRDGWKAIEKRIEKHQDIDAIVAMKLDRVSRHLGDYIGIKARLEVRGITLALLDSPGIGGAEGKMMEQMSAVFAEYESEKTSERTKIAMQKARESGRILHMAPIGLLNSRDDDDRASMIIDSERAPYVIDSFKRMATGLYTQEEIREYENAKGFRTRKNNPVPCETFRRMLRNEMYIGMMPQKGSFPSVKGKHDAIIGKEIFYKVQGILERNSVLSVSHKTDRAEFPLRRFVRCQKCGAGTTASWSRGNGGKYPYYVCWKCKAFNVRSEILEKEFVEYLKMLTPASNLLNLLDVIVTERWDEKKKVFMANTLKIQKEISKAEQYIDKLTKKFVNDEISREIYDRQMLSHKAELHKLRASVSDKLPVRVEIEKILETAQSVLRTPDRLWQEAVPRQRREIQKVFFPSGVLYSKEGGLRTPLSDCTIGLWEMNAMLNKEVATPTGIEPVLPA